MTTVEEKLVLDGQVWEPSDAEPLKEEVSQEKPTITQVDADSEATKENGHLNGSNEGIIEEPESDPEPVKPLDNSSMNIEEVFEPTEEAATEEAKPVESSEEDEPLSRLMKTTQPDQVRALNPFLCDESLLFIYRHRNWCMLSLLRILMPTSAAALACAAVHRAYPARP